MATHSSTPVWKIPRMEEPHMLQSLVSQSQTRLSGFTFTLTLITFYTFTYFYCLLFLAMSD